MAILAATGSTLEPVVGEHLICDHIRCDLLRESGLQQIGNESQNSSFVYALIIIQGFSYRRVASLMTGKKSLRPVFFVLQRQLV